MEKITVKNLGTFEIRPYLPEDERQVLSLWKTAFHKEMPEPLWHWKYTRNPFGCRILLCVNEAGEPVVLYGGIPYVTHCKGRTVEMTQLMDIMSHPEYRKTGLFIQTGNAFFDTFTGQGKSVLLYGFPGKYHFDIGQKYLSYIKIPADVAYLKGDTAHLASSAVRSPGRLEAVHQIDNTFDRLWENCKGDYPLSIIRNAAFLQWRFGDHPFHRYEIWAYQTTGKEPQGYAVLAVTGSKAALVDMLAPVAGMDESGFWGLLGKMLAGRGITVLETWLPGEHAMVRSALASGFVSGPEPIGIIPTIRIFDPDLSFEWACDRLYYTMADGDLM